MFTSENSDEFDPQRIFEGAFGVPQEENPLELFLEQVKEIKSGTLNQRLLKVQHLLDGMNVAEYDLGTPHNWEHWLQEETDDSYDWIIPDLLERGERVIVVAAEGVGKSFLARQVAIMTAAGLHPFTGARMKPLVTLTIDLENPDRILRRTSRRIMNMAREKTWMKSSEGINAHLLLKPAGVNLFDSSQKKAVEDVIKELKPDILFMGPLYKSFIEQGGRSAESQATEIAMYYDYLRYEYDVALWLEQHAPLGNALQGRDLRPFGSAVWSRWPEFGLALSPDATVPGSYVVKFFRGARDQRPWPETMHRGSSLDFPFVVDSFRSVQ